jgi:hypothetical protein
MDSETKLDPAALWMKFCLEWERLGQVPPSEDPRVLDRRRKAQSARNSVESAAGEDASVRGCPDTCTLGSPY